MCQLSTISRWFDPLDLKPEDVDGRDLAVSLSHLCRFNGHIDKFYSVAQHSIAVARLVEVRGGGPPTVLQALLHDAPEAYLCGDVPGPLKVGVGLFGLDIRTREWCMRRVIHEALGCSPPIQEWEEMVHKADRDMLKVEFFHLKPKELHLKFMLYSDMKDDALGAGLYKETLSPSGIEFCFRNELGRLVRDAT